MAVSRPVSRLPKKQKQYKVVKETVTRIKKKLKVSVQYGQALLRGYTFVPVGFRDLTEYCKEMSRQRGQRIYIATTDRSRNFPGRLGRFGYHFRHELVEEAYNLFNYGNPIYDAGDDKTNPEDSRVLLHLGEEANSLHLPDHEVSFPIRLQQICSTIKELFPGIPDVDLKRVVDRAFKTGSNTVGNAKGLGLPERVQLAVWAHIRHCHTDYDLYIREHGWLEARRYVEDKCAQVLSEWRGEVEDGDPGVEEVECEILCLDTDDEADAEQDPEECQPPKAKTTSSVKSLKNFVSNGFVNLFRRSPSASSHRVAHPTWEDRPSKIKKIRQKKKRYFHFATTLDESISRAPEPTNFTLQLEEPTLRWFPTVAAPSQLVEKSSFQPSARRNAPFLLTEISEEQSSEQPSRSVLRGEGPARGNTDAEYQWIADPNETYLMRDRRASRPIPLVEYPREPQTILPLRGGQSAVSSCLTSTRKNAGTLYSLEGDGYKLYEVIEID